MTTFIHPIKAECDEPKNPIFVAQDRQHFGGLTDIDIIEPDVAEAAAYITKSYRQGVTAILETGRRLIEVRERFKDDRGKWSRLIGDNQWRGQSLLPFQKTHVQRLIRIVEDEWIPLHAGVLPPDSTTMDKIRQLPLSRREEMLAAGIINPGMSRKDAAAETRAARKAADEERISSLVPVEGKYRTLVIDPPWDYEGLSLAGQAAPDYATMTHEQLMELDVPAWAEDNCHLYLWATNNFLTRAGELMAQWGFQHKTVLTWVKPRLGLGSYFRNSTEQVLFGVRGELRTRVDNIPTHFEAPMGKHSEKPNHFYDEIVKIASYPPYGEVFQRKERDWLPNLFGEKDKQHSRSGKKTALATFGNPNMASR